MSGNYFSSLLLEERARVSLWVTVAAVLLGWIAATLYVVHSMRATEEGEARAEFERRTAQVAVAIEQRLGTYAEVLRGAAGLFAAAPKVDRRAWRDYIAALDLQGQYPGILGVGFARYLRPGELAAHIAAVRAEGFPHYEVHPPGARDEYTAIVYLEPFSGANLRAFGYDMYAESVRRQAMQAARDSGRVSLSGLIRLVQDADSRPQPGFLMFHALREGGAGAAAGALRGYAYAAFRGDDFIAGIAPELRRGVTMRVLDADGVGEQPLYDSGRDGGALRPYFATSHQVRFGGRTWRLEFDSEPDLEASVDHRRSDVVSLAGLLVGVLFALLIGHVSRRRELAEASARAMTTDLRTSETRFRALTELSSDWHWEQGRDLRITQFSGGGAARRSSPDRFVGQLPWALGYVMGAAGLEAFRARLEAHEPIRDMEIEFNDDAGTFWMAISFQPQFGDDGGFLGYQGTAREITDRKRAEQALRHQTEHLQELVEERTAGLAAAKEAAERAYSAKSEFLANMSHELRTPLHAILSFARLGLGRSGDPALARLHGYFGNIAQAGERLLSLVNDLLDLAKIEAGKMPMNRTDADLARIAATVIAEFAAMAEERGIGLSGPAPDQSAPLHCDEVRLAQVLRNLVSNALKFSPRDTCVSIAVEAAEMPAGRRASDRDRHIPAWRLRVADQGIGIPEEELEAVFDKFVQSSKTTSGAGGTGLGLAICSEIVGAHRGTIVAANRPEGGAVFEILLPR